jgi:hypothetical protein
MNCDPGNVVAIWNSISGATQYRVRANIRRLPTQSLEEALASGNPIINDRVVNATTVNLRTILDREWAVGQEIVLQVAALIPGVGQEPIYSQPISFLLTNNTQTLGGGTGGGGGTTPVTIIPLSPTQIVQIGNILSAQPALVNILPPAVLQALVSGNLALTLRNGDGSPITPQQLQATLNYLQANPSQLLNIIYRRP